MDHIFAEHLKYGSQKLCSLLALLGSLVLDLVLKDKAGKLNSMDNDRPISLSGTCSYHKV